MPGLPTGNRCGSFACRVACSHCLRPGMGTGLPSSQMMPRCQHLFAVIAHAVLFLFLSTCRGFGHGQGPGSAWSPLAGHSLCAPGPSPAGDAAHAAAQGQDPEEHAARAAASECMAQLVACACSPHPHLACMVRRHRMCWRMRRHAREWKPACECLQRARVSHDTHARQQPPAAAACASACFVHDSGNPRAPPFACRPRTCCARPARGAAARTAACCCSCPWPRLLRTWQPCRQCLSAGRGWGRAGGGRGWGGMGRGRG